VGQRARRFFKLSKRLHVHLLQLVYHGRRQAATHGLQLLVNVENLVKRVKARDEVREVNFSGILDSTVHGGGVLLQQSLQKRALQVVEVAARLLKSQQLLPLDANHQCHAVPAARALAFHGQVLALDGQAG
jgi:hypothetical protein